ncbi:MAG: hypothetical protein EOP52_02155 [Sphingobacteriales bacterium]|nr:MAG: hypothetical protein EOP52_02155 [Sphingobacteriales bacterium]
MYHSLPLSIRVRHLLLEKIRPSVLAGLFLGAAAALTGCKKEAAEPVSTSVSPTAPATIAAMTRTDAETALLIKRAETFQQYANDLRENLAPNPGILPGTFSPAEAVELLETTTNYYYGRPNQFRPKDSAATFINAVTSAPTEMTLNGLAQTYNTFRIQFKEFYEAFPTERSFGYTDFEYNPGTQALVAIADIRYGATDPRLNTWQGLITEQTFTGYGYYNSSWPLSAVYNTSCPNNPDAMVAIGAYVKQNIGFYSTSANGPTPLATSIVSVAMNTDSPSAQINSYNYLAQSYPNIKNYNRFLSSPMPFNTPNPNLFICVDVDGMNYYRTAQKQMVLDQQAARGKVCIKYELSERQKPNGRTGVVYAFDYEHQLTTSNFQFANLVYTRLPGETRF